MVPVSGQLWALANKVTKLHVEQTAGIQAISNRPQQLNKEAM